MTGFGGEQELQDRWQGLTGVTVLAGDKGAWQVGNGMIAGRSGCGRMWLPWPQRVH